MLSANVRLFGIPVEIQPSFLVVIVLLGLPLHPGGPLLLVWAVLATIAILVHEGGHAAVARAFGAEPRIVLLAAGGATLAPRMGARKLLVMAAAGPIAGLLLGLVILVSEPALPKDPVTRAVVADSVWVTFGWSAFNLLPLGGLDGHAVLNALVTIALGRPAAAVGRVIGALVVIGLVVGTAALGWYEAAFMVGLMATIIGAPLGGLSRLFGASDEASGPELLALGRADEALAVAERGLRRRPGDLALRLVRADALRQLTRYADAIRAYDAILAEQPRLGRALAGRFVARRGAGERLGAEADLAALRAIPGQDPATTAAHFFAAYADQAYAEAQAIVERALADTRLSPPDRERFAALLVAVDVALGRAEDALATADDLLLESPDDFAVHEVRALALLQLGRIDEARNSAGRALAAAPHHPELLETLGRAERLAGRPAAALPILTASATARPDLPRARAELSACFCQLGRTDEAEAALATLPAWCDTDPHAAYARACLAAATGRSETARELVARAAATRPGLARIAAWDPVLRGALEPAGPASAATSSQTAPPAVDRGRSTAQVEG